MTNPPFGGEEEAGIQLNFPENTRASESALLFMQFIMRSLKRDGRCGVVVPNGFLFGDGVAARIKAQLLRDFAPTYGHPAAQRGVRAVYVHPNLRADRTWLTQKSLKVPTDNS